MKKEHVVCKRIAFKSDKCRSVFSDPRLRLFHLLAAHKRANRDSSFISLNGVIVVGGYNPTYMSGRLYVFILIF